MSATILLADDSLTIQKVVELTFADTDHRVVCTSSGDELLERLAAVDPDVVICDVIMPGVDGYQVCQQIKNGAATSHIPVLLLTGTFEPFDRDRAVAAGCDEIITKPFEARRLVEAVDRLLRERPAESATPEEFEGAVRPAAAAEPWQEEPAAVTAAPAGMELAIEGSAPAPVPGADEAFQTAPEEPPAEDVPEADDTGWGAPEAGAAETPDEPDLGWERPASGIEGPPSWEEPAAGTETPTPWEQHEQPAADAPWDEQPEQPATAAPWDEQPEQSAAPAPWEEQPEQPAAPAPWEEPSEPAEAHEVEDTVPEAEAASPEPFAPAFGGSRWGAPEPEADDDAGAGLEEPTAEPTDGATATAFAAPSSPEEETEPEAAELPEQPEPAAEEPEPAPATAAPAAATLSDDDVDRIARRVLELASERIEQIAWDVIPDMAEIVVRERIRQLEAQIEETGEDELPV